MLQNLWRRLGRNKDFIQGVRVNPGQFDQPEFKANMQNLTFMFQLRQSFVKFSPFEYHNDKYTNDMAILHKELNYQNANLILKRFLIVVAIWWVYTSFIREETNRDYKDKFDLKFNNKVYGNLDDATSE